MEIMKTAPFKLHSPLFDFPTAMEKQGFQDWKEVMKIKNIIKGNLCLYYLSVVAQLSFAISNQPLICNSHFS